MRIISSTDLSAIIDFIYQGKTKIPQERLNNFLALAEELKIHGLIQMQTLIQLQNETAPFQEDFNFRNEEEKEQLNLLGNIGDVNEKAQKKKLITKKKK